MAIAFTFESAQFSTTASTTYTGTTLFIPTANTLQIAFVCGASTVTSVDPTSVTGHGLTWTKLSNLGSNLLFGTGGVYTPSVWVAKTSASAGSSGSASANWATARTGGAIIQFEVAGIDLTVGSTATVVQYVSSTGTGTAGTATLTGPTVAANRPIAFYVHAANEATTPKSTWTESAGADGNFNNPATGAEVQFITSAYETASSASWTTSSAWRSFAPQILADAAVTYTAPAASGGIEMVGGATWTKTIARSAVTQDIEATGSGTYQKLSEHGTVSTQDAILSGVGSYSFTGGVAGGGTYSATGVAYVVGAGTYSFDGVSGGLVPNVGEAKMLQDLINAADPENLVLRLYKNDVIPGSTMTLADYTEATFTGYAPVTLSSGDWVVTSSPPFTAAYSSGVMFTCSGTTSENVYGSFVTEVNSSTLMWSERFPNAPHVITYPGDAFVITPRLLLTQAT